MSRGPTHAASYPLSILSTSLVGERHRASSYNNPYHPFSSEGRKQSFSRTFYVSPSWSRLWSLMERLRDSSLLLSLGHILSFLTVRLKNLKLPAEEQMLPTQRSSQAHQYGPFHAYITT